MACTDGSDAPVQDTFPAEIPGATGKAYFVTEFTPAQGLGPLYNGRSCESCHSSPFIGGMPALDGLDEVLRIGFLDETFDDLAGRGGPVARNHAVSEIGGRCGLRPGVPASANAVSVRNTPPLYGMGRIEALPDAAIEAGAIPKEDGVHGEVNWGTDADGDTRAGRFGWKADSASLEVFVAEAFRNELGLTNPWFPDDLIPAGTEGFASCDGNQPGLEASEEMVRQVTDYIASLAPIAPATDVDALPGAALFETLGCTACHTPTLGEGADAIQLYSDLLIHDLGGPLDDGFVQGSAEGRHWRTTPLWGLRYRERFLHDGRTTDLERAILEHGGAADPSIARFEDLTETDRETLYDFLLQL